MFVIIVLLVWNYGHGELQKLWKLRGVSLLSMNPSDNKKKEELEKLYKMEGELCI
jgi:hypothetical protein